MIPILLLASFVTTGNDSTGQPRIRTIAGTGTDSYGNPTGGGNYTKAFFTKGTLLYHCSIHPTTMQGVVIVN